MVAKKKGIHVWLVVGLLVLAPSSAIAGAGGEEGDANSLQTLWSYILEVLTPIQQHVPASETPGASDVDEASDSAVGGDGQDDELGGSAEPIGTS